MAKSTKTVEVNPKKAKANLQIIKDIGKGVPLFEPHKNTDDRVSPKKGTKLQVVSSTIVGSGLKSPEYYYITDNKSNGKYRRYFIKVDDVK